MFIVKFILNWFVRICVIIVVLGIVVYILRDVFLKSYIDSKFASTTGYHIQTGSVHIDLPDKEITLNNLDISYPPVVFGNIRAAEISELKMKFYLWDLLWGRRIHLEKLDLNIPLFQSVEIKGGMSSEEYMQALAKTIPADVLGVKFDGVDSFFLTVGSHKKITVDKDGKKKEKSFEMKISHKEFTNLTTTKDIITVLNSEFYPGK